MSLQRQSVYVIWVQTVLGQQNGSRARRSSVGRSSEDRRRRRVWRRYVLLARASLAGDVVAGKFILQKYYVLLYTT